MQRLTAAMELFSSTCVAAGVIWFVFTTQREITTLNQHLTTIEVRMQVQPTPPVIPREIMSVLSSALDPCKKKDHHK